MVSASERFSSTESALRDTPSAFSEYPVTVLLVDDQSVVGESVRQMLEDDDKIDFHYCHDPARAVPMAEAIAPTVILQDLVMPQIDGLELLRLFRANPNTCEIPLIMLSARDEPEIKAAAFAIGANDYLIKLPDRIELVARIRYHSRAYNNLQARSDAVIAQTYAQQLEQTLQQLQTTQAQLIQTEKLSGLGQMVAGVAHEINNPINFVVGNLKYVTGYVQELIELVQIYQEDYPEHTPRVQNHLDAMDLEFLVEDLPKTLNSMAVGTDRLNDIVLALRNFSRLDQAETQTADVHAGIDSTLLLLNHRIKKQGVEIIKQYGDLPQIECYPAQLNQVFMNILSNAIDALAEVMETQKQHITIASQLKKSRWVEISIQDNGPGISAENMEKLFDSFFTTKPVGKGTGLGLSIAQQIIERHNGTIEAFSEKEKGTKFVICLPIEQ